MALLADVGEINQFILTLAAILAALATIVASVRVLARVKVFATIAKAIVGDPLRRFFNEDVNARLSAVEAHQAEANGNLREAIDRQTEIIEAIHHDLDGRAG